MALIKEINENGFILIRVCALLHVALQCLLELVRNQFFQFHSILLRNKPIMEHPEAFMDPKSEDGEFGVAIEFIEDIDSLNNLADISHVEHVMRFCGCR